MCQCAVWIFSNQKFLNQTYQKSKTNWYSKAHSIQKVSQNIENLRIVTYNKIELKPLENCGYIHNEWIKQKSFSQFENYF